MAFRWALRTRWNPPDRQHRMTAPVGDSLDDDSLNDDSEDEYDKERD